MHAIAEVSTVQSRYSVFAIKGRSLTGMLVVLEGSFKSQNVLKIKLFLYSNNLQ